MSTEPIQTREVADLRNSIRSNADLIVAWPDGWFTKDDIADEAWGQLRSYAQTRAIEVRSNGLPRDAPNRYRVADHYAEIARETVNERDALCPCGHAGLVNQGEYYECAFDLCDREFAREELDA